MENSLSPQELKTLLSRFPPFELSYEIVKHKTTSITVPPQEEGEWAFHIPIGRKYFAWFSFYGNKKGCFWLELNRDRIIHKAFFSESNAQTPLDIHYGTILYGTRVESGVNHVAAGAEPPRVRLGEPEPLRLVRGKPLEMIPKNPGDGLPSKEFVLVAEDIFYYKGNHVGSLYGMEKWSIIHEFLQSYTHPLFPINIPVIHLPGQPTEPMYPVHHTQIRHMYKTAPYTNWVTSERKPQPTEWVETEKPHFKSFKKPQYQTDTIFRVMANIGDDMYNLYAFGPNRSFVFYDYALIQDYETSKKMNTLFRHLRESPNLDYMEESDDEEDGEGDGVELKKSVLMKCRFHKKFKKWMPLEIVPERSRIIHIGQL